MFSNVIFKARGFARRPWVRVALFCIAAVVAALAAVALQPLIPAETSGSIGSEAVDQILSILATSMLPVATFSLTTMVQAYGSATSNVTPRAVQLLMQDTRAQTALATFIGAFLYSVVGLIALKTDFYGEQGRVVVFVVTLVVMLVVVATLVRWIDTLSGLGRVGSTIDIIETAADAALKRRVELPYLGGRAWTPAPDGASKVLASEIGYVQHVNIKALSKLAEDKRIDLHLDVVPGSFAYSGRTLAAVTGSLGQDCQDKIRAAIVIGDRREYENDPRFGIIALSEVASRALSPAVNDPGTAIDVIGTLVRVLGRYAERQRERAENAGDPDHPRVHLHGLTADELFEDGFAPIARDGAGIVEVGVRLQKAFAALAALGDADVARAAERHADLALKRARSAISLEEDVAAIEAVRADGRSQAAAASTRFRPEPLAR